MIKLLNKYYEQKKIKVELELEEVKIKMEKLAKEICEMSIDSVYNVQERNHLAKMVHIGFVSYRKLANRKQKLEIKLSKLNWQTI